MAHPKGLLMERLKKLDVGQPEFRTANTGPAHQPTFLSDVLVGGEVYGTGQGNTKREAERLAAEEALAYLDRNPLELESQAAEPAAASTPRATGSRATGPGATGPGATGSRAAAGRTKTPPKADSDSTVATSTAATSADSGEARAQPIAEDVYEDGGFEGPWPVFEHLLATSLRVANDRTDNRLAGDEAREAVREFALELYKELLEDLGDVVEEPEDEER
ncbi:MAG: putative dsRNA-binding protein [Trueperaceae bacterium]